MKQTVGGQTIYTAYSALTGRIAVVDNTATGERFSLLDLGPVSVRRKGDGTVEYTHLDHLGSPVAATNSSGAVALRAFCALNRSPGSIHPRGARTGFEGRESYLPYGEGRLDPAANRDKPSFTGHIDDAATGLVYMQARYYDPILARALWAFSAEIDPLDRFPGATKPVQRPGRLHPRPPGHVQPLCLCRE